MATIRRIEGAESRLPPGLCELLQDSVHGGASVGFLAPLSQETAAAEAGMSLLVLDTLRGSAAERIYAHMGWTRVGEIPAYAASPDGELHPTVYFYKTIQAQGGEDQV